MAVVYAPSIADLRTLCMACTPAPRLPYGPSARVCVVLYGIHRPLGRLDGRVRTFCGWWGCCTFSSRAGWTGLRVVIGCLSAFGTPPAPPWQNHMFRRWLLIVCACWFNVAVAAFIDATRIRAVWTHRTAARPARWFGACYLFHMAPAGHIHLRTNDEKNAVVPLRGWFSRRRRCSLRSGTAAKPHPLCSPGLVARRELRDLLAYPQDTPLLPEKDLQEFLHTATCMQHQNGCTVLAYVASTLFSWHIPKRHAARPHAARAAPAASGLPAALHVSCCGGCSAASCATPARSIATHLSTYTENALLARAA